MWRNLNTAARVAFRGQFPPSCGLSLCRYYEYMFGSAKKQWWSKNNRRSDPSDLSELQVWITSPDSECDGYPSVTSDESCEYLPFLVHVMFYGGIQSGASSSAIPCNKL